MISTKREGLLSLSSSSPPKRELVGMPWASNTPFRVMEQTVPTPTIPSGTVIDPTRSPGR